VEDLGSTNGTFVNGQRIAGPQPLQPGDVIAIGTSTWRFEVAG
jgi:pSer/pThr/pTyr-binding forkhead associated (FHA) protein